MRKFTTALYFFLFIFSSISFTQSTFGQACDPTTPSFTVDLSGNPDSAWFSPSVKRKGLCCGLNPLANPPIRCVEFFLTLDTGAQGIRFDIAAGAIPPGSLGYQIGCGPYNMVGQNICLSGAGPHRLTFCKPGNNANVYTIVSIPKPQVTPPLTVSDGCSATLTATGFQTNTITWTSVPFNPVYNSYLSCLTGCSSVTATYQPGAPPYVDYQVSGVPAGGCNSTVVTRTTRVYFVNDKVAQIMPQNPTICFGGSTATITANCTGGAPPYKYLWNTGATTQSIDVGVGTFWVAITDQTSCPSAKDTVTVTAYLSPITANAGPDLTSCANKPAVTINGSVNQATGGIWSGGTGTYSPSNTSLILNYTPSPAEITAGSAKLILTTTGNGTCPAERDTMKINIVPTPIVFAGPDISVCANNNTASLNGSVTNAGGGTWSGGTGTFTPNANALNATYKPSAAEITAGSVILTLTSTLNGTCLPVTDQVKITITTAPTANAGIDRTVCANNSTLTLAGSVTVATGGVWSGGTGAFSPNNNTLNATYTPSPSERTAGTVHLTLTTTGYGNCLPVSDDMFITITSAPVVDAGADRTVCANNPQLVLSGNVTIATGGTWSGGTGSYSPSSSVLNATYTPSPGEIAAGKATLTLTSTGNGLCLPVADQMVITITPAPIANAGPDKTICANNASAVITGTVTNASGGTWIGGAGVFFPNRNSLNIQYTPTPAEITAGSVILTLETTGIGNCIPTQDAVKIIITTAPTVNAGPDNTICASAASYPLSGTVTVATGGTWSSNGTGSFSPNANTLTASYIPSASDKTSGTVTLTLTSTGNGNCIAVSDNLILTIKPTPIANAGPSQTICADVNSVALAGAVTNATGGAWSSNGTGGFTPSATTLNATYNITASDKTTGSVILTLTTSGSAPCAAATSTKTITITPAPTVNAGPDKTVCSDVTSVSVTGTKTVATGLVWSSSGAGTFAPSTTSSTIQYTPTAADKSSGSVTLTLKTTGNGTCNAVQDVMKIFFTPAPTVNAGPDQQLCVDNPTAVISGTKTVATGGTWTGGAGTFTPNRNNLNISYTPTPAEITAGSVTLTLNTTGNGTCNAVKDNIVISYLPGPTVNAGPDQTLCGNVTSVQLNGVTTNTTSINWTTSGTGSFTPNASALNATYIPSATDISNLSVTLTLDVLGSAGCNPKSDAVVINFTTLPSINAGPDQSVCTSTLPVTLAASGSAGTWTGGAGSFSPDANTLNAVYTPTQNEIDGGSITLTITTLTNALCPSVSDDVLITFIAGPVVDAGQDITVCADTSGVVLNGTKSNSPSSQWYTSGSGSFLPDEFTLNAKYVPSTGDITAGSIVLTLSSKGTVCDSVTDNLTLTITPAPTIDAGFDQTVCASATSVSLSGSVTVATGGIWTSTGSGGYNPGDQSLNTDYQITPADTVAHSVTLTLTTTGYGMCKPISDDVVITIAPVPVVIAGTNTSVCKDVTLVNLNGLVANATGGLWSTSGNGTFSLTPNNLTVDYYPTIDDKNNGSVTLTLTSTGNGSCGSSSSNILISFTNTPTISAGPDQQICADSTWISLTGSVAISTGGDWTSSSGGSFTNGSNLTTNYLVSSADSLAGRVVITFTSHGNGTCNPVSDDMILIITPVPVINAGPDQTICADAKDVTLFGSITNGTGVSWSSSGTGPFTPSATQMNTIYHPTAIDTTNGTVTITCTSTGTGQCKAVNDKMTVTITPAPVVITVPPAPACKDNVSIPLQGIVYHAGGGTWTTSGSGTFSPNANTINAAYVPSTTDKSNGSVTLTLTSSLNGTCLPVNKNVPIIINPAPVVSAGSNLVICADADSVLLTGQIINAGGGKWKTSGTGVFSPNDSSLTAYYKPSASDTAVKNLTLTLTSTHNNGCNPVSQNISLTITPAPIIHAGPDKLLCASRTTVSLIGATTVASGGTWTSNGTGTYTPLNQLSTVYHITSADTSRVLTFILTSTGNGTCKAVKDTMKVSFTPVPMIATAQATICADQTGANLSVGFVNATGVKWVSTGTGTFTPSDTDINPVYIPSALDFTNSPIAITVSTRGTAPCPAATANIQVTIKPFPIVAAGPDQTVCEDNPTVTLSGSILNATGGVWSSSGTGGFSPNTTQMNVTYNPSSVDISAGTVKIVLTTTGNGYCLARMDTMNITITPAPTLNAGPDQLVCLNQPSVNINGLITGSTGGNWTILHGTGNFSNPSTTVSNTYNFSAFDYTHGPIKLVLTTTGNGYCIALKDTVSFTFKPLPTVNAGPDQYLCQNETQVAIFGVITVATGATWHTTGTGTFLNSGSLVTRYYPSTADKNSGLVKLYLTTNLGNRTCKQVTDTTYLYLTPIPIANAGPDKVVCIDTTFINLYGSIVGATSGGWSSSGTGTFAPDTSNMNVTYTFSPADVNAGIVTLTLTTIGNLGCSNTDTAQVKIYPIPDIRLNNIPACMGDRVILDALPVNINNTIDNYTWYKNNVLLIDSLSTLRVRDPGLYVVKYKLGSCYRSDSSLVTFDPVPVTDMTHRLVFCAETETITLDAGPGLRYLWMQSGSTKRDTTVDKEDWYVVRVYNEYNCYAQDSVHAVDICPPRAFVPTIFTPNHDGHNDFMTVYGKYFTAYKLTIFNRWGEIIFYSEDPKNVWDGTYLGEPMPNGVYPWILYYEGLSERYKGPFKQEGSITIDK